MVRKIKWTIRALDDLHDIYEFIAKDSKRYAQIQIEDIQNAALNLTSFPLIGRIVPEFPHLSYREILVGNYRVIYRLEEEQGLAIIMAVAHGRQLLKISRLK
ncbi:MAG: type II toxin-antitoxin system RelE/ParE family toxin [Thermodesulfovibrionales bacterium]|nr:type II toxin-antitoxin system RelE/ParE family toxin [Thermodesulfovibrionales bacterium]